MQNRSGVNRFVTSVFCFWAVLNACLCEDLVELTCQDVAQCKQFQSTGVAVSCEEGICHCSSVDNGEHIECRPKDYIKSNIIGGACPCSMQAAECDEQQSVCYCAPDFAASADRRRCLQKKVPLGENCETDLQCASSDVYAICNATRHRCQCGPGFLQRNETCLSVVGTGVSNCSKNAHCRSHGHQAFCFSKKCLCPADYIRSEDNTSCIQVPDFENNCTETIQCLRKLGPGGVCHAGVCNCADTHFVQQQKLPNGSVESACRSIVVLGSYCRHNEDCYEHHLTRSSQSLECLYGECNCRFGYNSINKVNCTVNDDVVESSSDWSFSTQSLHYLTLLPVFIGGWLFP